VSGEGPVCAEKSIVVKLGGSLLDMSDLSRRLRTWLDTLSTSYVLLVPGGGATADVIRALDRCHCLGEETAHWLALRALSLNAAFLQTLIPTSEVIDDWRSAHAVCRRGGVPILDPLRFAQEDEGRQGHLPHCWEATSDALAARVAVVAQARELILLKSVTIRDDVSWAEAARCGYVDRCFDQICAQAGHRLTVRVVSFRELVL
jgi:aspartokinase-like uncharacterized kinase